jgi:hypothetical protein
MPSEAEITAVNIRTIRLVSLLQKQVFFEDVFKSTLYAPPFKGKATTSPYIFLNKIEQQLQIIMKSTHTVQHT